MTEQTINATVNWQGQNISATCGTVNNIDARLLACENLAAECIDQKNICAGSTQRGATGKQGEKGEKGDPGEQGEKGAKGDTGATGNGISSITKTSTAGLIDTYTITYTDSTTSTFNVTNGEDGTDGEDGFSPIANVSKSGNTATITITDSVGTTTATVSDGQNGQDGTNATITGATASVDNNTGTPNVVVTSGGTESARSFDFAFTNLKGAKGDTGNSGVVISTTEPTDPLIKVWINPDGTESHDSTKENVSNKVTSISSSSTNAQYPSAKCVYDIVGNIEATLQAIRGV